MPQARPGALSHAGMVCSQHLPWQVRLAVPQARATVWPHVCSLLSTSWAPTTPIAYHSPPWQVRLDDAAVARHASPLIDALHAGAGRGRASIAA